MSNIIYVVYETTNLINGKYYIGVHKKNGSDYLGSGKILRFAINKYGKENFIRETLKSFDIERDAYDFEKEIVDGNLINNKNCYNIVEGGGCPPVHCELGKEHHNFGKKHTKESKKKMSKSKLGKYKGEDSPRYGKHHSEEAKKKMSEVKLGKYKGEDSPRYGKKHTEETKKKISDSKKGKGIGKKHSKDSRKKISESLKGKYIGKDSFHFGKNHTEETKKKMSESSQGFIYFIEGNKYISSIQAGKDLGVHLQTIINWCKNPNKPNCYREKLEV